MAYELVDMSLQHILLQTMVDSHYLIEFQMWKKKYHKIPIVYLKSGAFYESIKEYDKSIKDYSMALELDSNQVNAYMRLGGIYHANRVNNTLAIRYYLWGFKRTKDPMYYANIAILIPKF